MKDHPLPAHPKQGFDAEHPDRRPEIWVTPISNKIFCVHHQ
jgi:hypothetical protein